MGGRRKARRNGAFGEELMVDNFMKRRTLRRIRGENLLDELLNVRGDRAIVRELVFIITNTPTNTVRGDDVRSIGSRLLIDGLDLLRLEWRTTNDKCVQNDADGPGVHFEAVTVRGVEEYLWSNIIWCATDGLLAFARILDQSSKAEIPDLDIHTGIQKQVSEFEITVNDLVGMHIMASSYDLHHKESDLGVGETTSAT
jgi:hypothetical protein